MGHLTESEKQQIIALHQAGVSYRWIARQLQRNTSTISRYLNNQQNDNTSQNDHTLILNTIQIRIQQYTDIFNLLLKKDIGMSHINDYTKLFSSYIQTDIKPDKKYSMLYSMLHYLCIEKDHHVADIWCGTGYFTHAISKYANKVVGLDNNHKQIEWAKIIWKHLKSNNIEYILADMWEYDYRENSLDSICAPFVINYSKTIKELQALFTKFFSALKPGGLLVGLIDNPSDVVHNNKEYGSIKTIPWGKMVDSALLELQLFNENDLLCTLYSCYYTQKTIEKTLYSIWYSKVERKKPLIAPDGINQYPSEYWINYINNCDIAYFVATK